MLRYLLLIVLAVQTAGISRRAAAEPNLVAATPQTVTVDGRRVHFQAIGLTTRRPGSPVVVFESGLASTSATWSKVIPDVAPLAPLVVYDRAGLGRSEWDGVPPNPWHAADRLRRMLRLIGAEPPYILVGHSWGGMLAHYFAGAYPTEIAGLVYVDPGPVLTQELSGNLAPFVAIGAGLDAYKAYWSAFAGVFSRAPPAVRAEFDVMRSLMDTALDQRRLKPLPEVPIVVVMAGKFLPLPLYDRLPFDGRAYFLAELRHRMKLMHDWVQTSPAGLLLLSNGTTHAIPNEAPELIAFAIGHVVRAAAVGADKGSAQ